VASEPAEASEGLTRVERCSLRGADAAACGERRRGGDAVGGLMLRSIPMPNGHAKVRREWPVSFRVTNV